MYAVPAQKQSFSTGKLVIILLEKINNIGTERASVLASIGNEPPKKNKIKEEIIFFN